eukprot:scaffold276310_cov31-Tisochrysis_lutea.AAC.1
MVRGTLASLAYQFTSGLREPCVPWSTSAGAEVSRAASASIADLEAVGSCRLGRSVPRRYILLGGGTKRITIPSYKSKKRTAPQ